MTRSKSNQVKKDPSSPVDDIAFGEEYVEYGGSLNAERTALSLTEDSSNSSSSSSSNDEGEMQPSQESYRDSDQGKARKPHGEPVSTRSQPISDDDSSSDEGLFTQMPIRPRQRFTTQEISILEKVYQKNGRPSAEMKQNLADKLDTTVNRIQIWFQNRRAKEKKTQEQSKSSADGPCTTSVPDINEPESSTRISSELRTRRSSAENSRQVPSKNEAKGRADDSGERYQEKSRHIEKKKPARQLVEDNPQSHIEHSVYPLANPPHTYYRYTPTMELIPPFYWPSHPLSYQPPRIGPSSSSPQPGQQEHIPTYVNPQKMLKKERRTQQFQQTPRYPYVEPLLPPLPTADAYQLPEQASENSKSTSESTIDDPEEHKRLPGKGDD